MRRQCKELHWPLCSQALCGFFGGSLPARGQGQGDTTWPQSLEPEKSLPIGWAMEVTSLTFQPLTPLYHPTSLHSGCWEPTNPAAFLTSTSSLCYPAEARRVGPGQGQSKLNPRYSFPQHWFLGPLQVNSQVSGQQEDP